MRFYFGGAIRAGRDDRPVYEDIIEFLSGYGKVLTEHVGMEAVEAREEAIPDEHIFNRDIAWLKDADIFVAEVTQPM